MFGYIAICWNVSSAAQISTVELMDQKIRSSARKWQVTFEAPGMRVYCRDIRVNSSAVHVLHGNAGVVLGTVFQRVEDDGHVPRKAMFGPPETTRIVATRGRELVDHCWGRYVAFLHSPDRSTRIVRSPSGEIDCLSTSIGDIRVYFSGTEQCPLLEMREFTINWDYLAALVATLVTGTRQTGLREIERVMPGECITVRGDSVVRTSYWHPFDFVGETGATEPLHAAEKLRRTTHACVGAWGSCYRSVLAMLSGGLDSSILVSVLDKAPNRPRIVCLNNRNPYDAISDERRYARLVAQHVGCSLIEREQDAQFSLEPLLHLPPLESPWTNVFAIGEAQRFRREVVHTHGIDAYFSGHGGDQIFFTGAADYMGADFVHEHLLHPKLLSVALQAARIRRGALWPTLAEGIRDGLRSDPLQAALRLYEFSPLVTEQTADHVRRQRLYLPHWFDAAERLPAPGKCWQIISLSTNDILNDPWDLDADPEIVNPLLSQPLQELCLSIPSYVLSHGARDRGLARVAFRKDVPVEILKRRDKGAIADYAKAIWASNTGFVRSMLLDGALVTERLLDKTKVEKTLAGDFSKDLGSSATLMNCAGVEAWLRSWSNSRAKIAA
jgi:asparagine synthase (glutamine-hydrolysing)